MSFLKDNRRKLSGQTLQGQTTQEQTGQTVLKQSLTTPEKAQQTAQATAVQTSTEEPAQQYSAAKTTTQTSAETNSSGQNNQAATQVQPQTQTGDVVAQAQQYLDQQLGAYRSQYGTQITDLVQQLQERPAFEYDVSTDPLYLQLRDIWKQDGLTAMEDTIGQAAQLTGGYGNSYAQMLGQQQYQGYLRQFNEMVPDLKEAAREDYDAEEAALLQRLGLLMEQDEQDYARWQDAIADQRYADELAYSREQDALSSERYDQEWAYQQEQDAYDRQQDSYDKLLELIVTTGYTPTAEELAAAGMSSEQAEAWRGYYNDTYYGTGSGSGSGGGNDPLINEPVGDDPEPVYTPKELGDPLTKEDYTHVYANCAVFAGNGAPSSEIAAYIQEALDEGSITQAQYKKLMELFGSLSDASSSGSGTGSRGGGSGGNRYNTLN